MQTEIALGVVAATSTASPVICWYLYKRRLLRTIERFDIRHSTEPDQTTSFARSLGADLDPSPPSVATAIAKLPRKPRRPKTISDKSEQPDLDDAA